MCQKNLIIEQRYRGDGNELWAALPVHDTFA